MRPRCSPRWISPSCRRREAFGRVVIEALHAGVPVVAYDDGALPELVRDNVEGRLVPAGNVGALASALAILAADAVTRRHMGVAARERARGFSHAGFVAECTALYRELLAAAPQR